MADKLGLDWFNNLLKLREKIIKLDPSSGIRVPLFFSEMHLSSVVFLSPLSPHCNPSSYAAPSCILLKHRSDKITLCSEKEQDRKQQRNQISKMLQQANSYGFVAL